jgi:hypothetical protein
LAIWPSSSSEPTAIISAFFGNSMTKSFFLS